MNLSLFLFAILVNLPTTLNNNSAAIDIGAVSFNNIYDNYSGALEIYYEFDSAPSSFDFGISISTESEHLVTHQFTNNDIVSLDSNYTTNSIYKYTFNINSIQHTTTYYLSVVSLGNVSFTGNTMKFYVSTIVNDFVFDYSSGYLDGYNNGYDIGFDDGYEFRKNSVDDSEQTIDSIWSIISNSLTNVLNVLSFEIMPGIPLYICIAVPIILGILLWVIKLGAQ